MTTNKKSGEWFWGDGSEATPEDFGVYAIGDKHDVWAGAKMDVCDLFALTLQYKYLCEIPELPKPAVELLHGHAYMFDHDEGENMVGLYDGKSDELETTDGLYIANGCTNIRKMAPEKES